jgi:uncharacterized repeat protein (TIGR04138 family)
MMQEPDFSDIVSLIRKDDSRYDRKAYEFVRQGLDRAVKDLAQRDPTRAEKSRHVTPRELLDGLRQHALAEFGPMALTILNAWGIRRCLDFGEIVFNLIEYKVFDRTEGDRIEDFDGAYDFDEAFVAPFLPASRPLRNDA